MMERVAKREVVIVNPQGLHARPADLFARMASRFASTIQVIKDDQRADGKSILDILMLAAAQGTTLTIVASGDDAQLAVDALARFVEAESGAAEMTGGSAALDRPASRSVPSRPISDP